ncbi:TRAP transporter T-component [Nitrosomonas sp. PY1]|uniref:TRAP transporter TatT component family protein n=1 Tax=Nitrosomonas sp. PY1 TaxID=1803906 RepID=UPI001FC8961B|nr:TRAP transporter TatT component family protein [Nitrosomonas sp. PY1]GKS69946.1 TRAP transporter T-component [Nitrosomonas sp. PY1]
MKESLHILKYTFAFIGLFYSLWIPVGNAQSSATLLTPENKQKIEWAAWRYAVDTPLLLETIQWLRGLTQESKDSEAIAELSRLEYMRAQLEVNKQRRMELLENCIATANRALALNANDVRGLFWKAVTMGKIAEDSGMLNALRLIRSMEGLLLKVIMLDETYENAGAHRALGRIYHLLPGFPVSFGSNQKALMHLQRAYELFPKDVITRAFYADLLYDEGQAKEARRHADFVMSAPIHEEDELEYAEYVKIARSVASKTNDRTVKLGNFARFQE